MHHVLPRADLVECGVIARVARTVRRGSLEDTYTRLPPLGRRSQGEGGSGRNEERIRE